jgi:hypothetical protein
MGKTCKPKKGIEDEEPREGGSKYFGFYIFIFNQGCYLKTAEKGFKETFSRLSLKSH